MTLHFSTLEHFGQFTKSLSGGYYANVSNLTIKGDFRPEEIQLAQQAYHAQVQTNGAYVTDNSVATMAI